MNLTISIAGIPIALQHRYPFIAELCRDYVCAAEPIVTVAVTEAQIDAELAQVEGRFPRAVCEATCLHRAITRALVSHGVMLIHSAVIAVDGVAYAFLAKSGVGKSTHIRLWQAVFGDRAVVVNGDKPMFSFVGDRLMAHGSPWRGKERLGSPISLPVGGICLLERGEVNRIVRAEEREVVDRIFHQVLLPTDTADLAAFMAMMNRILQTVPFYRLQCNMEQEAAVVAYRGMNGGMKGEEV